jgi:acyl-CoA synthetase (AMP-forming)/AMP-acid ligase II
MIFKHITSLHFKQILFRDRSFDPVSLEEAILHLSRHLERNFHSASPFVLLTGYNHIKTLIAYYAILRVGKIPALLDPGTRSIELSEIIADTDPSAIFFLNSTEVGFRYEEEIIFRNQDPAYRLVTDLGEVCTVAFTNAEDGFSKGALITESNLIAEVQALIFSNGLQPDSVTLALLPFYHLYGLVQGVLVPSHAGSTGIIADLDFLRMHETVELISRQQVTHLYTVPPFYYLFSKVPGIAGQVNQVKEFYSGGAQLSPFIFESFLRKTGKKIREGYGLTESSPGVALDFEGDEPVLGSIGKPLPGCEIKILDNAGQECLPGQIGEICIRGEMVFKGYLNHPEVTAKVLQNGWLHSGDFGKKDKHGNIYFTGLKKNMINVAGNNVYPVKLKRMLLLNENVKDVEIFGEASVLQGHVVGARIKLNHKSDAYQEEFKTWCYEHINNTLIPKIWEFK